MGPRLRGDESKSKHGETGSYRIAAPALSASSGVVLR
jgi:hypothetical protein